MSRKGRVRRPPLAACPAARQFPHRANPARRQLPAPALAADIHCAQNPLPPVPAGPQHRDQPRWNVRPPAAPRRGGTPADCAHGRQAAIAGQHAGLAALWRARAWFSSSRGNLRRLIRRACPDSAAAASLPAPKRLESKRRESPQRGINAWLERIAAPGGPSPGCPAR